MMFFPFLCVTETPKVCYRYVVRTYLHVVTVKWKTLMDGNIYEMLLKYEIRVTEGLICLCPCWSHVILLMSLGGPTGSVEAFHGFTELAKCCMQG